MIYLLGIGSPTHPIPASSWEAWTRPVIRYQGLEYISGNDPIFTHQYSQAWFDFRGRRDVYTNYFDNSVTATRAHKLFCVSLRDRFPDYSDELWGISASDYVKGYTAWGGPPAQGPIDGTIVPCATGGSLPFLYGDCMKVLRTLRGRYAGQRNGEAIDVRRAGRQPPLPLRGRQIAALLFQDSVVAVGGKLGAHGLSFFLLREWAHLRPRSNTFGSAYGSEE